MNFHTSILSYFSVAPQTTVCNDLTLHPVFAKIKKVPLVGSKFLEFSSLPYQITASKFFYNAKSHLCMLKKLKLQMRCLTNMFSAYKDVFFKACNFL